MRCTSYCTASSYKVPSLLEFLQTKGPTQLFKDVVHFEVKENNTTKGDVFYFSYGVVVCWGLNDLEESLFLSYATPYEKHPSHKTERDDFSYVYGDAMKIVEDEITLQDTHVLTKLAISHGLAQSVKLTIFEALIQETITQTKYLPKELAGSGKISLSRKEMSKKMGEIFINRNFINLHADILDIPEFFWNYPELEPFYKMSAHYLDISKRVDTLNKRLSVVHELFEILSSQLNHQHSSRLEWTIIILIVIEVCLAIWSHFKQ
ncbi:MAG: RMD1 family protein [Chlamydiota bacterium]